MMYRLNKFSRTELLIGNENIEKLKNYKVAVFGIGGVGSYVVEGLVRAGIYHIALIDDDKICLTNLNRQIHATTKTVGMDKVEAMKQRILDINPKAVVDVYKTFVSYDNADELIKNDFDYIVDAVDTITAKLALIETAKKKNIPIISCMGAANKLDPTQFKITDISKTYMCPVARIIRKKLRQKNINSLKVLFSPEEPIKPKSENIATCKNACVCPAGTKRKCSIKNQIPGSISFVPSVAGLIISGQVIKDLLDIN